MISQVSNWSKSPITNHQLPIILAVLLIAAGCENTDPYVNPGDTPNPNWAVTVDNDMTLSMTAIVNVSFAKSEGSLAAFIGNDCCAIATYNADLKLYWLYISPASEQDGNVQLRFYSPDEKRIFDATSTFPFRNDTQLGTVASPHTPSWTVAK